LSEKSVVFFIFGAYLLHNNKMNVHIIDSNSESDEEMSNIPPEVGDYNSNNCPGTIKYVNNYVLQIVYFSFC
jgi:hypothetical protein